MTLVALDSAHSVESTPFPNIRSNYHIVILIAIKRLVNELTQSVQDSP